MNLKSLRVNPNLPMYSALAALVFGLLLAGCTTRSISNSSYRKSGLQAHRDFKGELSEFDVLGIEPQAPITEERIAQALESAARVKLRKGSSLMLIQSGAAYPDDPMRHALEKEFHVVPFSGQPPRKENESYAKSLRLAAAQAGCEHVVCYWGVLESARKELSTKTISWVPIVGMVVPDEKQHMRIRLKVAIIDVRHGNWTLFSPDSFENRAISEKLGREASDQGQVEKLKRLAYEAAANDLMKIYSN